MLLENELLMSYWELISCELVMLHSHHMSRQSLILELRLAVASESFTSMIGPLVGLRQWSSSSSSWTVLSATGFLMGFLVEPSSTYDLYWLKSASLTSVLKPEAGSALTIAGGPSKTRRPTPNRSKVSHSTSCHLRFILAVAPTISGGQVVGCSTWHLLQSKALMARLVDWLWHYPCQVQKKPTLHSSLHLVPWGMMD